MSCRRIGTIAIAVAMSFGLTATLSAQDRVGERVRERVQQNRYGRLMDRYSDYVSPYVERDRWVDVTEWFDGNNFNPTNEQLEVLRTHGQVQGNVQADVNAQFRDRWYGYVEENENDWFYDYYDHGYRFYRGTADVDATADAQASGNVMHSERYLDQDGDGDYDAYIEYHDWDGDGKFEDTEVYQLSDSNIETLKIGVDAEVTEDREVEIEAETDLNYNDEPEIVESKRYRAEGTVANMKQTVVPSGSHTVAKVVGDDGSHVFVDIGPQTEGQDWSIHEGDTLIAEGPVVMVGDKRLMIADEVRVPGGQKKIERYTKVYSGLVAGAREIDVRGQNHTLVILRMPDGDNRLFDLGPSANVKISLQEGEYVVVRGVPSEIHNQQVVLATSYDYEGEEYDVVRYRNRDGSRTIRVEDDDKTIEIDRGDKTIRVEIDK